MAAATVVACVAIVLSICSAVPTERAALTVAAQSLSGDDLLGQAQAEIEAEKKPAGEETPADAPLPTDPLFAQAQNEMDEGIVSEPLGDSHLDDDTKKLIAEAEALGKEDPTIEPETGALYPPSLSLQLQMHWAWDQEYTREE